MVRRPPRSTPFPYTTLVRSVDHDIARLQIAVGDAPLVGVGERVGEGEEPVEEGVEVEASGGEVVLERLAGDVLHGNEVDVFGCLDGVDLSDVRMI